MKSLTTWFFATSATLLLGACAGSMATSDVGRGTASGADESPAADNAASDDAYAGNVPGQYLDMVKTKEAELARDHKGAQGRCGIEFETKIDWATFKGPWDNEWNPVAVVGNCQNFLKALGAACYEGHSAAVASVTEVRCSFDPDAARNETFSSEVHIPTLAVADSVLSVGYKKDMAFDTAAAKFLAGLTQ